MNDKSGKDLEAVMPSLEARSHHVPGGTEKHQESQPVVSDINLSSTKQKHYSLNCTTKFSAFKKLKRFVSMLTKAKS